MKDKENCRPEGRLFYIDDEPVDEADAELILQLWHERCLKNARAHYTDCTRLYRNHGWLTVANTSLSILILFLVNATLVQKEFFSWIPGTAFAAAAAVSGLVLVLTSVLHYVFRWEERARDHKSAGTEFANLQRKIERYSIGRFFKMSMLHNINREYNYISRSYPLVHRKIWKSPDLTAVTDRISNLEARLRARGGFGDHSAQSDDTSPNS